MSLVKLAYINEYLYRVEYIELQGTFLRIKDVNKFLGAWGYESKRVDDVIPVARIHVLHPVLQMSSIYAQISRFMV